MIIVLAQRKGGPGKSTIAVSLAAKFSGMGKRVGLLDVDVQETANNWGRRRAKCQSENTIETKWAQGDCRDTINAMAKRNDILIVDTGGFTSREMRFALASADVVLAPFNPKQYDLETAQTIKSEIDLMIAANPSMLFKAVINRAPTNAKDTRSDGAVEYLASQGISTMASRIYNREAYGDCTFDGRGVSEYDDKKAIDEIAALADEIILLGGGI